MNLLKNIGKDLFRAFILYTLTKNRHKSVFFCLKTGIKVVITDITDGVDTRTNILINKLE